MNIVNVFVGVDYHNEILQVCVLNRNGETLANKAVSNDARCVRELLRDVAPNTNVSVAIEACCGAANLAQELNDRYRWTATLAHPGIASRMKQNPDKTDKTDAWLLADLVRIGYLPRVWLPPEAIIQLRDLTRHRGDLVDRRRNVKLRLRAVLRNHRIKSPIGCRPWTIAWLQWLKGLTEIGEMSHLVILDLLEELGLLTIRISKLEKQLKKQLENDAIAQKLLAIEGIGLITAAVMRAEIGHFDRFQNGKQLAKYCGVTPRNASSGKRQADAGLIRGNKHVRHIIIQMSQRLMRLHERWSELGLRLRQQGKPYNVAVAAVANRFMRHLFHQMQPEALAM